MSYILDALRKSEQERRRGAVPTLASAATTALAQQRPAWLPYGLLAVLLLGIGLAIVWRYPGNPELAPAARASLAAQPLAADPRAVAALDATPPPPKAPAQTGPGQEAAHVPPPAPSIVPPIIVPPIAPPSVPPSPAGAQPAAPENAPEETLMTRSELPLAIQQELPPLSVAMHAYSSQAKNRLVSIDGRVLREGDALTADLKLERITPEGMVFSYRGVRFQRGIH